MCGIAGSLGPKASFFSQSLQTRLDSLRHRGPDGEGIASGHGFEIGQRRLEIVALGSIGRQPAYGPEGQILAFNGEIHNYIELAKELGLSTNQSRSDTHVLAHFLSKNGIENLHKLDGQFAFCFIDPRQKKAWLTRDRYGQKPLVYQVTDHCVHFASEVSGLPTSTRKINREALDMFVMSAHYPSNNQTFFEDIHQLSPGACIQIDLTTGEISDCQEIKKLDTSSIENQSNSKNWFKNTLEASLRKRLLADTEIGLLLSAGKDSASLLSMFPIEKKPRCISYSNGSKDDEYLDVKDWYSNNYELILAERLSPKQLLTRTKSLQNHLDAPILSASLLALDQLFQTAQQHQLRCLISGQGADELLGGYHYFSLQQKNPVSKLLGALRLYGIQGAISKYRENSRLQSELKSCINKDIEPSTAPHVTRHNQVFGQQLQTMLWYEDRISMASGVEVRYPFLNDELVYGCLSLPDKLFYDSIHRKKLLSSAFAKTWPSQLQKEKLKRGLPASEANYIVENPNFFQQGLVLAKARLNYQTSDFQQAISIGKKPSDQRAKAIWRIAMAGHWAAAQSK